MKTIKLTILAVTFLSASALAAEPVNVENFARAETDHMLQANLQISNIKVGELFHVRQLTPIDRQPAIRMNRDTFYSGLVQDLSKPAKITLPEIGGRYQSMHVINQDHYSYGESKPGIYSLTQEKVGSRYAYVIIRTFVDSDNPEDVKEVHKAQDAIVVKTPYIGTELELPEWDKEELSVARDAINTLAKMGVTLSGAFGLKNEVDPIKHLLGTAAGWGGMPARNSVGVISSTADNSGTPHSVTVKDVPVRAFWSITIYNKDGFFEKNDLGRYSFNNHMAEKNKDGSITINFGDCEDGRVNCLPISEGWNYTVRMYEPEDEIINGKWTFPIPLPVK